jgi:hypothetical protein
MPFRIRAALSATKMIRMRIILLPRRNQWKAVNTDADWRCRNRTRGAAESDPYHRNLRRPANVVPSLAAAGMESGNATVKNAPELPAGIALRNHAAVTVFLSLNGRGFLPCRA